MPEISDVVNELAGRFGTRFSIWDIERCVRTAVNDLAGSIAAESLPEMAIRLAAVRLASRDAAPGRRAPILRRRAVVGSVPDGSASGG